MVVDGVNRVIRKRKGASIFFLLLSLMLRARHVMPEERRAMPTLTSRSDLHTTPMWGKRGRCSLEENSDSAPHHLHPQTYPHTLQLAVLLELPGLTVSRCELSTLLLHGKINRRGTREKAKMALVSTTPLATGEVRLRADSDQ